MHFARDSLKGTANFEAMKMEDCLQTSLKHVYALEDTIIERERA